MVTYELDGAPEVVRAGACGFLVPPEDVEAIADRTLELLRDRALRQEMGARGRAFAAEHYPVERMVEAINAVYRRALAGKTGVSLSWRDRSSYG